MPELTSKIRMPPSKWQQLNRSDDGEYLDMASFLERAVLEVKRFKTKLEGDEFVLETVEPTSFLTEEKAFNQIAKLWKSSLEFGGSYSPLMTWHGTRNPDNITQIIAKGYKHPGEFDIESGECIDMRHGNAYGNGIYTSVMFEKSRMYSFMDNTGRTMLLVNLVILGRVKFIPANGNVYLQVSPGSRTWKHILDEDGLPDDSEYDTLALPDLREVISSRAEWVVPLFRATLCCKDGVQLPIARPYWNWRSYHESPHLTSHEKVIVF